MPKVLFITGDAGSGKTYILAEKMKQLLTEDAGNKCLFMGSHEGLVKKIQGMMEKSNISNKNWRCIIVGEFLYEVSTGKEKQIGRNINPYSDYHVFIDEYQDTNFEDRVVIETLLLRENSKGKFRWMAFDDNQSAFATKTEVPLSEKGRQFPLITLPAVYRLTPEVYKFVKSLQLPAIDSLPTSSGSLAMALPIAGKGKLEFFVIDHADYRTTGNPSVMSPTPSDDLLEDVLEKLAAVYQCLMSKNNAGIFLVNYLCDVRNASEILKDFLDSLFYSANPEMVTDDIDYAVRFIRKGLGDFDEISKKLTDLIESVKMDGAIDQHLVKHAADSVYRDLGDFHEKGKRLRDLLESSIKEEKIEDNLVNKYAELLVGKGVGDREAISSKIKFSLASLIKDGKMDEELEKFAENSTDCGLVDFTLRRTRLSDLLERLISGENTPPEHIMVIFETDTYYYTDDNMSHMRSVADCAKYGVSVQTMKQVKGLESPVIIACFPGLSQNVIHRQDPLYLLRVAASRAMCKLFVLTSYDTYQLLKETC